MTVAVLDQAGKDLDPAIARFIAITGEAYSAHPPFSGLTPPQMRAVAASVREPWVAGGPVMARTEDYSVPTVHGSVRVRVLDPGLAGDAPKPVLIYIHGGGWMIFSIDTHDRVMREYAARAGVVIVGIDYSLAPEARFPIALDEVLAGVRWVRDHAADLGIDASRIAIGGDSVGGNMSVAAAMALRDNGEGDLLKGLVLNYGAFDDRIAPEYIHRYGGAAYMLNDAEMEVFWGSYLNSDAERANPLAVPMRGDVSDLPPAFFAIPECDVLRGQSHALYARWRAAGSTAREVVYPGASHSFLEAISIAGVAAQALDDGASFLKRVLEI